MFVYNDFLHVKRMEKNTRLHEHNAVNTYHVVWIGIKMNTE